MFNPGAEAAGPSRRDRQFCLWLSVFNASQDSNAPSGNASRPPSPRSTGSLGGLRVLVVEDDPDARELVAAILEPDVRAVLKVNSARIRLPNGAEQAAQHISRLLAAPWASRAGAESLSLRDEGRSAFSIANVS